MTAFESIKQVNNIAASLLAQGKIVGGGRLCQQGLTNLKTFVDEAGSPHTMSPFAGVEYVGIEVEDCVLRRAQLAYSPNNAFELYNCTFSVDGDGCNMDTMAAVLFYNLALALHCRGIIEAKEASLQKALHFYQASAAILYEEVFHGQENRSAASLYLANLSNQSHLFSHWMDQDRVSICLDAIFGLVRQDAAEPEDTVVFYQMLFEINEDGMTRNAPSA